MPVGRQPPSQDYIHTPEGQDLPIVSYHYDANSGKGTLVVDISGKGLEARHWVVENIGKICSDKNIAIVAGEESREGAAYHVFDESVKDGLLTIEFEALY